MAIVKVITGNQILVDGNLKKAFVLINEKGRIEDVLNELPQGYTGPLDDFQDLVVMPGICDTHVHINEPGRTDWEGLRQPLKRRRQGRDHRCGHAP